MVFTHDTELALQAAVTLANSALEPDTLTTRADLDGCGPATSTPAAATAPRPSSTPSARSGPGCAACSPPTRDAAVELVNSMLSEARAVPQLVRHDRLDWHIHAIEPDQPSTAGSWSRPRWR